MKILIVDDSEQMCASIKHVLESPDVETFSCTSSAKVLAMYEEHQPDIVVMDIRIKPLNGIKTTQLLKNLHPKARVIMLTSHNEPEYREAARQAGASGYVLKDNLPILKALIREI